jgi:hypothetical protein
MQFAAGDLGPRKGLAATRFVSALGLSAFCAIALGSAVASVVVILVVLARVGSVMKAVVVISVGWAALAALTPLYHPYARLLLPLQALSWVLLAGLFRAGREVFERVGGLVQRSIAGVPEKVLSLAVGLWISPLVLALFTPYWNPARGVWELLEPSDSLRRACRSLAADLPRDLRSLRLYARPPVTFYLSDVAPLAPQPSLDALLGTIDPKTWALLDWAVLDQEGWAQGRAYALPYQWDVVRQFPSTMNLPTLLDHAPSAARERNADRDAPLMLFRPRRPGAAR